jgi:cellulose synthase/poly-beta-1,6-N-acetylglucosamine synthase-like glycosyltransferase
MEYVKKAYFHVGRAADLTGTDRTLYRFLEMVPGLLAWGTLLGSLVLSYYRPVYAAFFIIIFDLYWLLKTMYLSIHLRQNWKRTRHALKFDWKNALSSFSYDHIYHLVLLPFYDESLELIDQSVSSLLQSEYNHKKTLLVLAIEERAGDSAREVANTIKKKFSDQFGYLLITIHPARTPGEMPGKGSNITHACEQARVKILDALHIPYENVLVSALDSDTVVYPHYFQCLTWHFLNAKDRYHASYQPVPLYNNNMWQAPAFSRVVASSGTFWQMIQQERPERLATFSSHAVPFKTLYELGYWQKNMVSEDSRIFWNAYMAYNSEYRVVPLSYPVSMDANVADGFWMTLKNIYKQQRRWAWGAENLPYILFNFIKNKEIPFWKKVKVSCIQLEGYWSLSTNPLMIFLLGWAPLALGGHRFNTTVLSYNLPFITRDLMIFAMTGLILSAIIAISFLPPMPKHYKRRHKLFMALQWVLVPVSIIVFGALPGLEAQTRLMIGRYLGFWVTPKYQTHTG